MVCAQVPIVYKGLLLYFYSLASSMQSSISSSWSTCLSVNLGSETSLSSLKVFVLLLSVHFKTRTYATSVTPINLISYLLIHSINLSSLRITLLVIIIVYFYQVSIPIWAFILCPFTSRYLCTSKSNDNTIIINIQDGCLIFWRTSETFFIIFEIRTMYDYHYLMLYVR